MKTKIVKKLAVIMILIFYSSCSPKIALTDSNSFGSTEACLIKVETSNDNDDSEECNETAEKDIEGICAGDLQNCDNSNFRKIVRPTGGCSRPNSCLPIPTYLLHIYPYDYTKFIFNRSSNNEEEPIVVIVNNQSKKTSLKNVYAQQIEGLKSGEIYNITIETKDDNGNIATVVLNSITINEQ